jgi:hypothetical protein
MKVSKESMKKLGFVNHKGCWQHERFLGLCFTELPEWHKIVYNSFIHGKGCGRLETQKDIKEALGIY